MARYKPVDPHLSKLLPVKFSEQIIPGTFEYAVNWLVDQRIDLSVFDAVCLISCVIEFAPCGASLRTEEF